MTARADSTVSLVTCSYGPDFERCQRLCHSVDRWVAPDMRQVLIVPARDLVRFRTLENHRRDVVAVEDLLPAGFRQLPVTSRWWLAPGCHPVRGWILQQLVKLSADRATTAEHIVFADSDLAFVRPFTRDSILRGGQLRLHRIPGAKQTGRHLGWHYRAAHLLGLAPEYFGNDYIGQLISWRRSHLIGLKTHIEAVHGRPWHRLAAASLELSEYILYGAYVDAVVGLAASGHYACADDLCHCCWFADEATALERGDDTLRDNALAILLQSNLGLSARQERGIIASATRHTHLTPETSQ